MNNKDKCFNDVSSNKRTRYYEMSTMNFEENPFDEDETEEDLDDTFPDAEEDEVEETSGYGDAVSYPSDSQKWAKFIVDPWPTIAFVIIVVGLAFTVLTPPAIWALWSYTILLNYGLIAMAAIATVNSIKVWVTAGGSRLKYGGLTNVFLVIACAIAGTIDTIFWMFFGVSFIPGFTDPILMLCMVLVLFSMYSLWLIQRTFVQEPK